MLALAADGVFARGGVVLNPHYKSMGLYGSEYWTYSLPRAVGYELALRLSEECLPISVAQAREMGLVQDVGPRCPQAFGSWLMAQAQRVARDPVYEVVRARWRTRDVTDMERCRDEELAQMRLDMVEDRNRFSEKCRRFVLKQRVCGTPRRLLAPWANSAEVVSG